MALELIEGEIVAVPPTGRKLITLNSDGDPVILSPDGTEADIGSDAGASWFDTEAAFHASKVSALTVSKPLSINDMKAVAGANVEASVPDVEGGAIRSVSNAAFRLLTPGAIWTGMKTSYIGLSFQATFGAIEAAKSSYIAISNSAGRSIRIGTDQSVSATNVIAFGFDGAAITSPTIDLGAYDGLKHTFCFISDKTTMTLYMDGVAMGTILTAASHYPSEAGYPAIQDNVTTSAQAIRGALYSYAA